MIETLTTVDDEHYDIVANNVQLTRLGVEYPELIDHVLHYGDELGSRLGKTRDIAHLRLTLDEPEYCVVGRKGFSYDFMREEIIQLLAGRYDYDRLRAAVALAADLITPVTSYGPRVHDQLAEVGSELLESPDSRRAVVYVGRHDDLAAVNDPERAAERANEMPCTCLWQFRVRNGALDMAVYMRSWDLVWGLSYDVPSFVAVQTAVARHLGVPLGQYVHTAGSAHVYERHWDLKPFPNNEKLDVEFVVRNQLIDTRRRARQLMGDEELAQAA